MKATPKQNETPIQQQINDATGVTRTHAQDANKDSNAVGKHVDEATANGDLKASEGKNRL